MTRAEQTTKLEELRASVEADVKSYNEAYQEKRFTESDELDKKITEAINEYTGIVRDMCFADCKAADDPMLAAVRMLTFTTIGIKDTEEGEGDAKIAVRSVIEKERQIDLLKLHKFVGGDGIGADKTWPNMAEQFNLLLTAQKAKDLGIDPKSINDSYAMSEIARGIDLGKNPTSNTNILKTLRKVIAAMLGEEYANKAVSHDVNFLMSVYSRKSRKALTVSCANHKYLRGYLAEICHRIVCDKKYEVDYKKAK